MRATSAAEDVVPIRVAWLAPFPTDWFELPIRRKGGPSHPATWLVNLAGALAMRPDIELHVVTLSNQVDEDCEFVDRGVTFHVLKRGRLTVSVLGAFQLDRRKLRARLARIDPQVVHAHGTEDAYGYTAATSRWPSVISLQGIITELHKERDKRLDLPSLYYAVVRWFEQHTVRRGSTFVAKSDFAAEFVRHHNAEATIHHLGNAIAPRFFEAARRPVQPRRILFVGYLTIEKGIVDLLEAFALVNQADPTAELRLIGRDDSAFVDGEFRARVATLGLEQRVSFLGFCSAEQVAAEMERAALVAAPSHMDTSPNVVSEAMVAGVPLVATNVGGIPSMVEHGVTGLMVEPRRPDLLAAAILQILDDPTLASRLADAGRCQARSRHLPSHIGDKTVEIYRSVRASGSVHR